MAKRPARLNATGRKQLEMDRAKQRIDARAELERWRTTGAWREWHSPPDAFRQPGASGAGGGEPRLCVRSCSWSAVHNFLRRMRAEDPEVLQAEPGGSANASLLDAREFNIDYIIRQCDSMRNGLGSGEMHVLLQLQIIPPSTPFSTPSGQAGSGCPLAPPEEAIGVIAATVTMSRRHITLEFKAIYVAPAWRKQRLANAMVAFALQDVRRQTCTPHGGPAGAASRAPVWPKKELDRMMAFVVLPHCMQTSAQFWRGVGFELGDKVDKKEHKQATLRAAKQLTADVSAWTERCVVTHS